MRFKTPLRLVIDSGIDSVLPQLQTALAHAQEVIDSADKYIFFLFTESTESMIQPLPQPPECLQNVPTSRSEEGA
jgi:hypothetical protein